MASMHIVRWHYVRVVYLLVLISLRGIPELTALHVARAVYDHDANNVNSAVCLHAPQTSSLCDLIRDQIRHSQNLNNDQTDSPWPVSHIASCHACPTGQFWDPNNEAGCRPYLSCEDIEHKIAKDSTPFAMGGVKQLFRGRYGNLSVVVAVSQSRFTNADFDSGIDMLEILQNHSRVVQIIGACKSDISLSAMVTPMYESGAGHNWENLLASLSVSGQQEIDLRLQACMDYLEALQHLHMQSADTIHLNARQSFILCDAREGPTKLLSQFLVTKSMRLVLNDVDATPNTKLPCPGVPGSYGARCGHAQFSPLDFVAPEQLWPYNGRQFNDLQMPCYSDKVDIWRVPETLRFLLGNKFVKSLSPTYSYLFESRFHALEKLCKHSHAQDRGNATLILSRFREMKQLMINSYVHAE